jgi:hypothetical protein
MYIFINLLETRYYQGRFTEINSTFVTSFLMSLETTHFGWTKKKEKGPRRGWEVKDILFGYIQFAYYCTHEVFQTLLNE